MGTSSLFIARLFGPFFTPAAAVAVSCSPCPWAALRPSSRIRRSCPPRRLRETKTPPPFGRPMVLLSPLFRRAAGQSVADFIRPARPAPSRSLSTGEKASSSAPPSGKRASTSPPPARRVLPTPPAATDVGDTSSSRRAFLAATADAAAAADAAVAPPPLTDAASFSRRALSSLRCVYVKTPAMVSTMPATDFTSRGRPKSRKSCGRQRRGGSVYDQVKKHARRRSERDKHKKLSGQDSYDVRVSIERGWSNRSCSSNHAHLTMS